jgi:hypothetical protein
MERDKKGVKTQIRQYQGSRSFGQKTIKIRVKAKHVTGDEKKGGHVKKINVRRQWR